MKEPIKYKLPVGITTTQQQLRERQKQLLKEQYHRNANTNKNMYIDDQAGGKFAQRRYSERNLQNPEIFLSRNVNVNGKDEEIRRILTNDLKSQIQYNQNRRRRMLEKKLEEERASNQMNKQIASRQFQASKQLKQKIQIQMAEDYLQKIRRKQQEKLSELNQKQRIKNRLKQLEAQSTKKKQKTLANSEHLLNQIPISSKIPDYYKDVASYQLDNYKNYQQRVKNTEDAQTRRNQDIIQQRIRQNRRKQKQLERLEHQNRQNRKQQLQRVLEQQILESQSRKQEQKAYDKQKFYGSKFENIYHPICNPVDSRFCKDNKYIINELYYQGDKKRSRESLQPSRNGQDVEVGSSLARKGSLSLL